MPKPMSGMKLIKSLQKMGFSIYGRKGSHVKMISEQRKAKTIVPVHKELSPGTLNNIFHQAKLTPKEMDKINGK